MRFSSTMRGCPTRPASCSARPILSSTEWAPSAFSQRGTNGVAPVQRVPRRRHLRIRLLES
jgi:hypothetical protein